MRFLVLVVLLPICLANYDSLTEEQKTKLAVYHGVCIPETGVEMKYLEKLKVGDMDFEDQKAKDLYTCIFKKVGVMDDKGVFLKDVAISKLKEDFRAEVGKEVASCVEKVGNVIENFAWNFAKCYHFEKPGHAFV